MSEQPQTVLAYRSEPQETDAQQFLEDAKPHFQAMAYVAARLASPSQRDDIVQDALATAWEKRRLFDPSRGTFRTWLLAITANQAHNARRRRRWLPIGGHQPSSQQLDETRLDLEAALEKLSTRQRLAVDCFYIAGLTVAETAAVMRCSVGTVKSTLSDARKNLRSLLEG